MKKYHSLIATAGITLASMSLLSADSELSEKSTTEQQHDSGYTVVSTTSLHNSLKDAGNGACYNGSCK